MSEPVRIPLRARDGAVRGAVRVLASELDRYINDTPQIVSAVPLRVVEPSGRQRVTRLVAIG